VVFEIVDSLNPRIAADSALGDEFRPVVVRSRAGFDTQVRRDQETERPWENVSDEPSRLRRAKEDRGLICG